MYKHQIIKRRGIFLFYSKEKHLINNELHTKKRNKYALKIIQENNVVYKRLEETVFIALHTKVSFHTIPVHPQVCSGLF